MVPISSKSVPISSGCFCFNICATSSPNDFPKLATSSEWVNRLCTNTLPGSGKTCVLFCNLLKGAEKIRRSESRLNSERSSLRMVCFTSCPRRLFDISCCHCILYCIYFLPILFVFKGQKAQYKSN